MKGTKVACLVLLMVLAGIAYGSQMMAKKKNAIVEERENANIEFEDARQKCELAETTLGTFTSTSAELRDFLKLWEPHIDRLDSAQEAENALLSIVRASGVLVLSQKTEPKENRGNLFIPKSLVGSIIVQDDYAKTMNFLGELERTLPLARITQCHIKQGDIGQRINLEIHVEIPIVNLQANIVPEKKK